MCPSTDKNSSTELNEPNAETMRSGLLFELDARTTPVEKPISVPLPMIKAARASCGFLVAHTVWVGFPAIAPAKLDAHHLRGARHAPDLTE
eukprot:CAMPEP_0183345554 /NCGR_PEP_ID=MMETSP0164_2-20130417/10944_1 /TAXON_ID=221442 /ORGANISM="Coccolithus pelagicus ssp braarudi, Strain PLY182g" /LENGTH=90 /DNA_ID=CAMNT_0025516705 /DNA_START=670 /DNA_END=941 /DNA_ORIENTATION=+